jgi:hypothetical protein
MRLRRVLPVLLLLCSVSSLKLSAQSASSVQKDVAAVDAVEGAIQALGGSDAVLAIKDSVITGTLTPTKGSWMQPGTFVWKTSGQEFRYEVQVSSNTQIFASGHGHPAVSKKSGVKPLFYHMVYGVLPFHVPALVLLSKVTDPDTALASAGPGAALGKVAATVQANTGTDKATSTITQQLWYLDTGSGLPLRVEYRMPQDTNMALWVEVAMEFGDFRQVNGVLVPFAITTYEDGLAVSVLSLSSAQFNVGLAQSEFDLLGGGQ